MEFIEKYRDLAEFIYFLSGPLLLGGLLVGMFQLRQFRNESLARFTRETINTSLSILDSKIREIASLEKKAFNCQEFLLLPEFEGEIKGYSANNIECTNEWLNIFNSEKCAEFYNLVMNVLNEIETLSQYIFSGITDEELCYQLEGSLILSYIDNLEVYMAAQRENEEDTLYENIIKLKRHWDEKSEHDIVSRKHRALSEAFKNLKRPSNIRVVGK